ncbi:MFS transporter, partial [Bacillus altitudinis]|uniref:MFS transporter n=1 Tax=Bacillus altitudinis TaxID=293387 RepID=UPI003B519720
MYYPPKTFTTLPFPHSPPILPTLPIPPLNLLITFLPIKIIHPPSHKPLLLFQNLPILLTFILLPLLNPFFHPSTPPPSTTIISLPLFILIFPVTCGPVLSLILPDLFPLHVPPIRTALSTFLLHTGNLII